ncbi:hypothetical protein GDO86_019773 [Hymenochirus boettgeri]|uniref:UPAR/Ly6 domain-containing protein n=1 Tax=Hymenochirus boettgeri TaxID=247094 RepID=A0A8T2IGD1_9PIPI|nr:hypothetical protein GDO86_019773 [Hymenochirus boettgeri]
MTTLMAFRVGLVLGLVLLVMCSKGDALKCYQCPEFSNVPCDKSVNCPANTDSCLTLRLFSDSKTLYKCKSSATCDRATIKAEYGGMTNFEFQCCQTNLCNRSLTIVPSVALLLILSAVSLLFFSR